MKTEHLSVVENIQQTTQVIEQDVRQEATEMEAEVAELEQTLLAVQLEDEKREQEEQEARNLEQQIRREGE